MATATFNATNLGRPAYLRDLLLEYQPTRTLRSSTAHLLHQPLCAFFSLISRLFCNTAIRASVGFKYNAVNANNRRLMLRALVNLWFSRLFGATKTHFSNVSLCRFFQFFEGGTRLLCQRLIEYRCVARSDNKIECCPLQLASAAAVHGAITENRFVCVLCAPVAISVHRPSDRSRDQFCGGDR